MDKKSFRNYEIEDFLTDESFVNYCFRKNTDDELFWEEWLLKHPEKETLMEHAKEMLQMFSLLLPAYEYQEELERIKSKIIPVTKRRSVVRFLNWKKVAGIYRNKRKRSLIYQIAAVFIFCIGGYMLLQHAWLKSSHLAKTYNKGNKPLIFTLDDSTVVTLAAHSSLRYPSNFGAKERKVYLDGEAGFHVNHNAAHPFKVYEDDIVATVLGTVFNVRKQGADSVIVVELLQGKVKVEMLDTQGSAVKSIILNPNERVVYNRYDKHLNKEVWVPNYTMPLQNHIVFQQDNFEAVAKKIKNVFGVTLNFLLINTLLWMATSRLHGVDFLQEI
jgi:transmembrane sensor